MDYGSSIDPIKEILEKIDTLTTKADAILSTFDGIIETQKVHTEYLEKILANLKIKE
jgi:DNA-binding IscR family transcriptional regulator